MSSSDTEAFGAVVRGITPRHLRDELLPQARFLLLPGVDERLASALVETGHRRYGGDRLSAHRDIAHSPRPEAGRAKGTDPVALAQLQLASARALLTGLLLLRVYDARTRKPIGGATLTLRSPGITPGTSAIAYAADADQDWSSRHACGRGPSTRDSSKRMGIADSRSASRRGGGIGMILAALEPGRARATTDDFGGVSAACSAGEWPFESSTCPGFETFRWAHQCGSWIQAR